MVLPKPPEAANLIEFDVSATATFRFFVDAASISVGPDGVVRYTLVARSPSGAQNVSYEGIRCKSYAVKVFAGARPDGTWVPRQNSEWREIEPKTVQRWHNALAREYFCPQRTAIRDPAEGVDALRRGGHPHKAG